MESLYLAKLVKNLLHIEGDADPLQTKNNSLRFTVHGCYSSKISQKY